MRSRWITVGLCVAALAVLIVRLVPHRQSGSRAGSPPTSQGHAANAYLGLRNMAIESARSNFGLGPGASPTQPFVVVADCGDERGATTVVAVADGSASVYWSDGRGSIGGGQSDPMLHDAAQKTLVLAAAALPQMHQTGEYPVAGRGQCTFYLVTDAGVFTSSASQDDLNANRSPLSELGAATQTIVAAYKRLERR